MFKILSQKVFLNLLFVPDHPVIRLYTVFIRNMRGLSFCYVYSYAYGSHVKIGFAFDSLVGKRSIAITGIKLCTTTRISGSPSYEYLPILSSAIMYCSKMHNRLHLILNNVHPKYLLYCLLALLCQFIPSGSKIITIFSCL